MRLVRLCVISVFVGAAALAACGGGGKDNDPFATYQDCFNEHHTTENFDVQQAMVICCISHPIGSAAMNVVCGSNATDCASYITSNLMASDVAPADITAACMDYVTQRSM